MAKKKVERRGGPRGGGRPTKHGEPSTNVTIRLPNSILAYLATVHDNRSAALVQAIQKTPGYKKWKENQPPQAFD